VDGTMTDGPVDGTLAEGPTDADQETLDITQSAYDGEADAPIVDDNSSDAGSDVSPDIAAPDAPTDAPDAKDAEADVGGDGPLPANPVWRPRPPTECATAVASGWLIGCTPDAGNYDVYRWVASMQSWTQITNSWAVSVSTDFQGNAWVIDAAGSVSKWNGSGFTPLTSQPPCPAASVASGSTDSETWVVCASDGSIWNWTGSAWAQVPGAYAAKVAVFSTPTPCGGHAPWVKTSDGGLYQYVDGAGCTFPGQFRQVFASATDITTDLIVGSDDVVHLWMSDSTGFRDYVASPWRSASTRIGGWAFGVFAINIDDVPRANIMQLVAQM
jgi:hypothetical protein